MENKTQTPEEYIRDYHDYKKQISDVGDLTIKVKVEVDDTDIQNLRATLQELNNLLDTTPDISTFFGRLKWLIRGKKRA